MRALPLELASKARVSLALARKAASPLSINDRKASTREHWAIRTSLVWMGSYRIMLSMVLRAAFCTLAEVSVVMISINRLQTNNSGTPGSKKLENN